MKRSEISTSIERRISMYKEGISVSAIASKQGVSRQAIIQSLKKAGVHGNEKKLPMPKVVLKQPPLNVKEVVGRPLIKNTGVCPIDEIPPAEAFAGSDRTKRIGRNLYSVRGGVLVKSWADGTEVIYGSREEMVLRYPELG